MQSQFYYECGRGLTEVEIDKAVDNFVAQLSCTPKKVLLLPPDITRLHSAGGMLASKVYHRLEKVCEVNVMPALGTHEPMSKAERDRFFDRIPDDRFLVHDWRHDVVTLGVVPAAFVRVVSEGIMDEDISVQVNRALIDGGYDLIVSFGQIVPHEVVGMANYTKNILVGVGGSEMINKSHMLGALYGMERMMGRDKTPVRKVFDYAQEHFLKDLPLCFFQTVTTNTPAGLRIHGLFIGDKREVFEAGVKLSQEKNMIFVDEPFKKAVVYLDPSEFKSTWLGNKAIYRTRMAMADGGDLIILAPGVFHFGEDAENDRLIRKYGYIGREKIIELFRTEKELQNNQSVAAHLVHGSSDGRFNITYCTRLLTKEEVEGANFKYIPYDAAVKLYNPDTLRDGRNTLPSGEQIFYISNPALGLWADPKRFV
jgi:nickel-dependent lactate racemase